MQLGGEVIRVLIADDHAVVREGIRGVLGSDGGFEVVGEAIDGWRAVTLARKLEPDVVVLDLSMPGLSGFEAAEQISRSAPAVRILILSVHEHEEYVSKSIQAGAHGYLRKDSSPAELRAAVRAVAGGNTCFPAGASIPCPLPGTDRALSESISAGLAVLTNREREILIEIARGRSNKEMAAQFSISVRTVESHREALMRKLCTRGTAALTRLAIEHGLIR